MLLEENYQSMVTADRELEQLRETLEEALDETDDDSARYHIRRAAQRVVILRNGLDDDSLATEIGRAADDGTHESA
jgi:hypothetical protein